MLSELQSDDVAETAAGAGGGETPMSSGRAGDLTSSQDLVAYNREAWDRQVAQDNMWTRPVGVEVIDAARRGEWSVVLTGNDPTPREWFPQSIEGQKILCLASGGGQQGPVLAAAGARVTVFDNSSAQLAQDRRVSDSHTLGIRTVQGDMADLTALEDASFDVVFHPVSNVFAPDVRPVWQEARRVLRPGGRLLAGFMNPAIYVFDNEHFDRTGERVIRYAVPYSDARDLSAKELAAKRDRGEPMEFGHSLTDLIGGQITAGFRLIAFAEGHRGDGEWLSPLKGYLREYISTCAVRESVTEGTLE